MRPCRVRNCNLVVGHDLVRCDAHSLELTQARRVYDLLCRVNYPLANELRGFVSDELVRLGDRSNRTASRREEVRPPRRRLLDEEAAVVGRCAGALHSWDASAVLAIDVGETVRVVCRCGAITADASRVGGGWRLSLVRPGDASETVAGITAASVSDEIAVDTSAVVGYNDHVNDTTGGD